MRWRAVLVVAGIVATLGAAPSAHAEDFVVTTLNDNTTSTCAKTDCPTIRAALTEAGRTTETDDTVTVPPGTTTLTAGDLVPPSGVAIIGASARTTIIQGDGKARIFTVAGERIVTFQNLTMANGTASGGQGGNLLVSASAIVGLSHVRVTGGAAAQGAGIAATAPRTLLILDSLIDHNVATQAATGAGGDGGGLFFQGTSAARTLQMNDTTIAFNTARSGGGIDLVTNAQTTATMTRLTVARNTSTVSRGGGIHIDSSGSISATGSIFANNTGNVGLAAPIAGPANCTITFGDGGGNLESQSDCGFKLATDRQNVDPGLSSELFDAGGQTDLLTVPSNSAAIGLAGDCTGVDQRDMPRPQGGACDAGAYEYVDVDTTIAGGPSGTVNLAVVTFTHTSTDPLAGFECRLDGPGANVGTFNKCASSATYRSLADGVYTFRVRAVHGDLVDATPATRTFTMDTTAPAAPTITAPPDNSFQSSTTVTLSGNAEAGSTVEVFEGATSRGTTTATTQGTWTRSIPSVGEGSHTYTATARDAAGNVSGSSNARTITVDTTAPNAPVISGTNTLQKTSAVTLSGTAEANAMIQVFDGATSKGTTFATGGNWTLTINPVPDGTHNYTAKATDAAGNTSAASNTRTITIDTVAPNPPAISGTNTLQKTSAVTLSGTAEASAMIEVFDGATSKGTTFATGGNWTLTINPVPDGTHNYTAKATDAAGNTSASSNTRTITVDTVAPNAPTITTPPANISQGSSTVHLGGGAEPGSTVEVFEGAASRGTTTAAGGNWTLTINNVPGGAHSYVARATDAATNTSGNSNTRTITVDLAIPDTDITDGPDGLTKSNAPSFSFTSTKPNSTFQCKLDGAPFATCTTPKSYAALAEGEHTFSVYARDAVGNEDPTPATATFTVDTIAPTTMIDAGPNGPINHDPTFAFHASEVGTFQCAIDDDNFGPCSSPKTYGDLVEHEGAHEFRVRATDAAGNVGDSVARSFSIDTTTPPADVTSGPSGATTETSPSFGFSSTDTGSTFECKLDGPGAVTGAYGACTSPASFSGLQPGEYVFSVRATDGAGNQTVTSRAFTVTVAQQATPTPTPTVTPAQEPTPEPNKTVVIQPVSGKTLVKLPGSSKFEPVDVTRGIPNGSTVDTTKSKIRLFAIPKAGKPAESALFYDGIFKLKLAGGITELQLVERLSCPKAGKADAAAKKKKTRKLWGDGSGSFRTRGQYSSATVRGTRWLVQDYCDRTLTRVAKGVVEVQDFVKHKKLLLRAPKSYTARKKKR